MPQEMSLKFENIFKT